MYVCIAVDEDFAGSPRRKYKVLGFTNIVKGFLFSRQYLPVLLAVPLPHLCGTAVRHLLAFIS
jgi:hypothetical protein